MDAESLRLLEHAKKNIPLPLWGPYLSERQWGTVREDYSPDGDAWNYVSHDQARSRAYLWGEDGLGGISDYFQNLCFAIALWNGRDPILKERLFGLTNSEGNHGEDVKELYYYLDNLPSHYYMHYLYKYPHAAYPYVPLINENAKRSRQEPEYELLDTGVFSEGRYFDVHIEYAKKTDEDIFIRIEIVNLADGAAAITVLPTLWFYNRWQYGGLSKKPVLTAIDEHTIQAEHERLGTYYFYHQGEKALWFTENETNRSRLNEQASQDIFMKDAFHDAVIQGKNREALAAKRSGTKCAPVYELHIEPHSSTVITLRLSRELHQAPFTEDSEALFAQRRKESDAFYEKIIPSACLPDLKQVLKQAYSGLLWNKQYYHLDIDRWLNKSDGITPVSEERKNGRNHNWIYLKNQDVIVMPDKWEYPWYAAWDTAFHCIPMTEIDPLFAKNQLLLLMREWYMNPQGQLPAYEWNFSDVNPPVHAFCALQVYEIEKARTGTGDLEFLKKVFQKLTINFTWWANREDANGNNIFEGGFLGLDNIGLFNRSSLPNGALLEQADGTSWMGMYALNMLDMALEISMHDPSYEDSCTKFYEHFVLIAEALNQLVLWDEKDRFFYDKLLIDGGESVSLKVRSVVGLIPMLAVSRISKEKLQKLPDFKKRMDWLKTYRTNNQQYLPNEDRENEDDILLSLVHKERLVCLLDYMLDESEFLSGYGIRGLSKQYAEKPYELTIQGHSFSIAYDPGDATSGLFGGNSNWRGPVWMPINFLIIKALRTYAAFYGDSLKLPFPTGSSASLDLNSIADGLTHRLLGLFGADGQGRRPVFGGDNAFYQRPENKNLLLFYEYFHGDNGRGLGASHQTGWTALITHLAQERETYP
jgi:hypothetical protein